MSHEHWFFPCDLSLTIRIHDDGDAYLAIHIDGCAQSEPATSSSVPGERCAEALHELTEQAEDPRPLFSTSEAGNRLRLAFFRRHLARLRSAIADGPPDARLSS
jgi:hypothetical protein